MKFVAYFRVSTAKQGVSGLGLESQQQSVRAHIKGISRGKLLGEYTEVESGKRNDRPQLANALALCRIHGATLIIAKLDRLARNVAFIANLMESGVEFCAVDMPAANRLTVHVLASVAEWEAKTISERTKAALQAARARGVRLGGGWGHLDRATALRGASASALVRRERAKRRTSDLAPVIRSIQAEGATSLRAVAATLNEKGIPAPNGGVWHGNSVRRVVIVQQQAASSC